MNTNNTINNPNNIVYNLHVAIEDKSRAMGASSRYYSRSGKDRKLAVLREKMRDFNFAAR